MIDWDQVAPMIVAIVLFLTVGGVPVLRPIAKRVGDILEIMARDRQQGLEHDLSRMQDLMETMRERLHLMEERQDFTERLLAGDRKKEELPPAS